jgi:S-DNA-T family DNA segregation ATPase FtsK/SpoIIIE
VSDAEVSAVTEFWRQQAEPQYDPALLDATEDTDDGDGGQFAWLGRVAEDELTPRAAELVMQTGRASTSMMQTRLKVGFNRATRLMDQLEKFGIVGPLDPRNPGAPRQVYGPDNWVRDTSDGAEIG